MTISDDLFAATIGETLQIVLPVDLIKITTSLLPLCLHQCSRRKHNLCAGDCFETIQCIGVKTLNSRCLLEKKRCQEEHTKCKCCSDICVSCQNTFCVECMGTCHKCRMILYCTQCQSSCKMCFQFFCHSCCMTACQRGICAPCSKTCIQCIQCNNAVCQACNDSCTIYSYASGENSDLRSSCGYCTNTICAKCITTCNDCDQQSCGLCDTCDCVQRHKRQKKK